MSKFKGTRGEVRGIFTSDNTRAVRNSGGIICTLLKPRRYSEQYERYETELEENKHDQNLIVDAFKVRQKINCELSDLLEQNKEMLAMLQYISISEDVEEILKQKVVKLIKKVNQ